MRYPKFLKENSNIGITAPSAGIYDNNCFNLSLEKFKNNKWNIIETDNVRVPKDVSSSSKERAKQFLELEKDDKIDTIICATGGDFLTDILPFIDLDSIKEKWVMGSSDPTNLLYLITTAKDIATIYGSNAGSFDSKKLFKSQEIALEFLKGNLVTQKSYDYYEINHDGRVDGNYNLEEKVEWKTINGPVDIKGRLIGGCIDCLKYLPGTKYDYTKNFLNRYKNDKIIWYFDIFSLTAEDFYLSLFQLKEAGWFENIGGVIVGRVLFPKSYTSMTYEKALKKIFKDIPIIMEADIGHVAPKMTLINGSIVEIKSNNGKGSIQTYLK